jgi:hypothetical protein
MSFLDIIKRGGRAAARGVSSAIRTAAPAPAPTEAPVPEPQDTAPKGFTLPELDPNDSDYEEKKMVHDAMIALEKHYSDNMPGVDFEGHYRKLASELKNAPSERQWNPLSKFAIAMGTQNPENPYAPNVGLAKMEDVAGKKLTEEKTSFDENMALRKEALSGHIRQLLDQGKFRQALGQLEVQSQMGIMGRRKEHEFKLGEIEAQGTVKKDVARINAQSAMDRAEKRLAYQKSLTSKIRLSPANRAYSNEQFKMADTRLADIKKQWGEGMLSDEQVEIAEEEHRQELKRLHDWIEEHEIPEGVNVERGSTVKPKGGMEANPEDPWFKK